MNAQQNLHFTLTLHYAVQIKTRKKTHFVVTCHRILLLNSKSESMR